VRFKTGETAELECQSPPVLFTTWTTSGEDIEIIRRESASHTTKEIVKMLNDGGYRSGKGMSFSVCGVGNLIRKHNIPTLRERLKAKGLDI